MKHPPTKGRIGPDVLSRASTFVPRNGSKRVAPQDPGALQHRRIASGKTRAGRRGHVDLAFYTAPRKA